MLLQGVTKWSMALYPGSLAAVETAVGVSDMCLLEPLTEENMIDNLRHRFEHDQIYVSLNINPMTGKCWFSVVDGGPTSPHHWYRVYWDITSCMIYYFIL